MVNDRFRDDLVAEFGHAVRKRRLELGLRQADLASLIGRSQTTVSHFEGGQRRPDLSDALLIAKGLEVSLAELTSGLAPLLDSVAPYDE